MRGAGPVSVNGAGVYGYFMISDSSVRFRMSLDDWDRLGLCEGQRVVVGLPGREAAEVLLVAASRQPPVVWLDFTALAPSRSSRAG